MVCCVSSASYRCVEYFSLNPQARAPALEARIKRCEVLFMCHPERLGFPERAPLFWGFAAKFSLRFHLRSARCCFAVRLRYAPLRMTQGERSRTRRAMQSIGISDEKFDFAQSADTPNHRLYAFCMGRRLRRPVRILLKQPSVRFPYRRRFFVRDPDSSASRQPCASLGFRLRPAGHR